jgi:hypothetical protein
MVTVVCVRFAVLARFMVVPLKQGECVVAIVAKKFPHRCGKNAE